MGTHDFWWMGEGLTTMDPDYYERECRRLNDQLSKSYDQIVTLIRERDLWLVACVDAQNTADAALRAKMSMEDERDDLRSKKDGAYYERNQVVAALAKCFPSGVAKTAIEGWSEDWHGCVYIDLPTGQVSWHYHDSHAHLFADLPEYRGGWDGHDTPEKYRRLNVLRRAKEGRGDGE